MSLNALYQEVHLLALHYHWSEADILRLPFPKRRRYLRLLAQHLGTSDESELT